MAQWITNAFIESTDLNENNSLPHLIQSISPDLENEINFIEHSKYYSDTDFINMYRETKSEITILNLNCCSLNARIDMLKIFLATIDEYTRISCITLQETWCDDSSDMSKFILPGYTMVVYFNINYLTINDMYPKGTKKKNASWILKS